MPRFLRFVGITSALLFFLYLFYPNTPATIHAATTTSTTTTSTTIHDTQKPGVTTTQQQQQPLVSQLPASEITGPVVTATSKSLQDRLAQEFPYNLNSVFPGFIWQTWKTTPSQGNFEFRTPEASWTSLHPGYIHEVITDEIALRLVRHLYANVPEVLEAYHALPKAILKADFFRYLILLARGGVYSDIDTEALRPAWEWVPGPLVREKYGLVIGIEADPDRPDWKQWYSRRVQFCQWTIRAKPGHPALIEAVATLTEKTLAMKQAGTLLRDGLESIVEWTGPAMWTDAVFRYLNSESGHVVKHQQVDRGKVTSHKYSWKDLTGMTEAKKISDVVILPITGFSPGQGHMGSEDFDDPHAMVKHDFEGSWKPESERMKEETSS